MRQHLPEGDEHLLTRSYAVTHPRNVGLADRRYRAWDQLAFAAEGVMTVTTPHGDWVVPPHRAVWIPAGVIYSYPVTCSGGQYTVVQGLPVDEYSRGKMTATHQELLEERDGVKELI